MPGRGPWQAPAVNREELARILVTIGEIALAFPRIPEIDITPLTVAGQGLFAVDAALVLDEKGIASGSGYPSAGSFRFLRRIRIKHAAPTLIEESATLKAGQWWEPM